MAKIILLGPAHPLRGGIAAFNNRLATQFVQEGHDCEVWSFSLQYPSLLFPGKTQFTDGPAPEGVRIFPKVNSINPLNWIRTGNALRKLKPDLIVVRYWLPFMGPSLGTILRCVRRNKYTKIICIADNVIPHEKRPGDKILTHYFTKSCDAFITMSEQVKGDLRSFEPHKPILLIPHPLYDNFGKAVSKADARAHLKLPQDEKLILFFGFIRKYKGLDLLLQAMKIIKDDQAHWQGRPPKLLIAGEFYDDEKAYLDQIEENSIKDFLYLHTSFISDTEVKYYLCAADVLVQPYRNATQSGVTPLAYFFEKATIVTNVGGLASLVPHEACGLVTEPDPRSLVTAIERFYELGEGHFKPCIRTEREKYSWKNFVSAILELAKV